MLTYNNGKKEGVFIFYFKNGNKKSEGVYDYLGNIEKRCWDENGKPVKCLDFK